MSISQTWTRDQVILSAIKFESKVILSMYIYVNNLLMIAQSYQGGEGSVAQNLEKEF